MCYSGDVQITVHVLKLVVKYLIRRTCIEATYAIRVCIKGTYSPWLASAVCISLGMLPETSSWEHLPLLSEGVEFSNGSDTCTS